MAAIRKFENFRRKTAILVLKTSSSHQNVVQNRPSPNLRLKNEKIGDSGQPLSENLDGLSLTTAKKFAF